MINFAQLKRTSPIRIRNSTYPVGDLMHVTVCHERKVRKKKLKFDKHHYFDLRSVVKQSWSADAAKS